MSALHLSQTVLQEAGFTVYPIVIPQGGILPSVVTSIISEAPGTDLERAAGWYDARIRLACHASSAAGVNDLAERVKDALWGEQHRRIETDSAYFLVNFFKGITDLTDYSDDRTVFRRIMDYRAQWWRYEK